MAIALQFEYLFIQWDNYHDVFMETNWYIHTNIVITITLTQYYSKGNLVCASSHFSCEKSWISTKTIEFEENNKVRTHWSRSITSENLHALLILFIFLLLSMDYHHRSSFFSTCQSKNTHRLVKQTKAKFLWRKKEFSIDY